MQPLKPFNISLSGKHLIEASAGTGKTYTLTLLYLRLLLEKKLSVEQILVVTFTRAATDELRTRIRQRLRDVLHFLDTKDDAANQEELEPLLHKLQPETARQLVNDALIRLDEAAIFTIHGFCQRILQDNAFESGLPFELDFIESEQPLRLQIIEDFWRRHFYSLDREKVQWISSLWDTPKEMLADLSSSLALHKTVIKPVVDENELTALQQQTTALWEEVCTLWQGHAAEIEEILYTDSCLKRGKKDGYHKSETVPLLVEAMHSLAGNRKLPYLLPGKLGLLQQNSLDGLIFKKCSTGPKHPFFLLFEQFYTSHQRFTHLFRIQLLQKARIYISRELLQRKCSQSQLFFDDLLTSLAKALENDEQKSGEKLAKQIGLQFPAALVDEFQDTDPLQYAIFASIYSQPTTTLFMIGDPKQAIYSFRGADIFTYIHARRRTPATCLHTMDTNYRSSPAMVGAVNRLFTHPDAFLFEPDIGFHPVQPDLTREKPPLTLDGTSVLPFNALLLDNELAGPKRKKISKTAAEKAAAEACAQEIGMLLAAADRGKAHIRETALSAGDIAVLVRTHFEAESMQKALSKKGITSVYANRTSVFSTREAGQVLHLLTALHNLKDGSACCTALATDCFGLDGVTIAQIRSDSSRWDRYLARLQQYRQLWQEKGIMVMLHLLFSLEKMVQRLTGQAGGERKCTNFFHLAELLHTSPAGSKGTTALIRWFEHQRKNPDPDLENEQLRLENDEQLVKIVTIHKAKGLEYPVVFLPFLWNGRKVNNSPPIIFHDRDNFATIIDFEATDQDNLKFANQEQAAENVRLLYVALTRARCCCYFCWGNISDIEHAPLHRFFHYPVAQQIETDEDIITMLEALNRQDTIISIKKHPCEQTTEIEKRSSSVTRELQAKTFSGKIRSGTLITSYSQLTMQHEALHTPVPKTTPLMPTEPDVKTPFTFPKGPTAGTCLHAIFEQIDFSAPPDSWKEWIIPTLVRYGIDAEWKDTTKKWIEEICRVELVGSCSLNRLTSGNRLDELSFLFPLETLDMEQFNQTLTRFQIAPMATAGSTIQGMMKGFIDLVFCHQDRFYIADYKSNYLGADPQDYTLDSLEKAMHEHRYDLQYLIYTIALNRYLKSRMAEYDYNLHFGGVYYLFIRGMDSGYPKGNGIYFTRPDKELIEELDKWCRS